MNNKFRCWNEDHFIYSDDKWEHEYPQDGDGWFGFEKGVLKAWVSETITPSDLMEAPYPSSYELESPIEQFTGLKDKNGEKDVYGGDKIRGEYACLFETHVVEGFVFYDELEVMWMLETPSESIALSEIEQYKIIGSIHDEEKP